MLALSIVNVATPISSVALCLSPYPDFHRIHKTKHTGEVRILPMIMLCCNSTMWGLYGVAIESYFPVVPINVFGALVATAFVAVFYRCTTHRATLNMMLACTTAALLSVAIFTFLAKAEAVSVSPSQLKTALGYCAVTVKTCLFVSPLQTTKLVIRTKSSASLLVTMCVVNLITGVVWVLFALLSNDMFILAPNALGVFLSIIQVGLCIKNRPEPEVDDAEDTSSVVGISIVEDVGPQSSPTKKVQFAPNSEAAVITFAPASSYEDFETPRPA